MLYVEGEGTRVHVGSRFPTLNAKGAFRMGHPAICPGKMTWRITASSAPCERTRRDESRAAHNSAILEVP